MSLFIYVHHIHHVMHTCIMLTLCVLKAIIDSRWVGKEERFVKGSSTSMSESVNEESRLDQLEAKVAEMMEQLQVLTNIVTSLTVPSIANNRDLCNRNEKTIGESSRIKTIPDYKFQHMPKKIR